jgi:hypothetical protein
MNKQTIQQVEDRQRLLILRIARAANELKELDIKLKRMRHGKIKMPAPAGVKRAIETRPQIETQTFGTWLTAGDDPPSFGD